MDSDNVLKAELEKTRAECERLREENTRLRLSIGAHHETPAEKLPVQAPQINQSTHALATVRIESLPELKVSLFMNLFRGRDDVYAVRWEGKNGRTGYSPAGIREWDQAPIARRGHKRSFRLSKLFSLDEEVICSCRSQLKALHRLSAIDLPCRLHTWSGRQTLSERNSSITGNGKFSSA